MKNVLTLIFLIFTLVSYGQDKVTFKTFFKPNKVYKTSMITTSETEVNFGGSEAIIAQIKSSGTKLPIVVTGSTESITTTTTGSITAANIVPARMVFDKAITSQNQNEQLKEDKSMTGLIIEGSYEDGYKLKIDTMISATMNEQTKVMVKTMLEKVQNEISFPKEPMKIGDSFDQRVPLDIPVGPSLIKMVINTNYKLIKIENNKATFDLKQTVTLDFAIEQNNVSATGTGTGVSEFDIVNNTLSKSDSDLAMTMSFTQNEVIITAKVKSVTKQTVTVE